MSSPETATATKPALAQDWLNALRGWLRGRNGAIAFIVLAVVIGAALNWSWLVAVGIAPFLITVLPCAVMCGLGLCMNKIVGNSCSTETDSIATPRPSTRLGPSLEAGEPGLAPVMKLGSGGAGSSRPRRELVSAAETSGGHRHEDA